MPHTAHIIIDPTPYATGTEADKERFIKANKLEHLGASGIAFSIICCGDPATIERHTKSRIHNLKEAGLRDMIRRMEENAAARHEASVGHMEVLRTLQQAPAAQASDDDAEGCEHCG